jgi:hypothetical protein
MRKTIIAVVFCVTLIAAISACSPSDNGESFDDFAKSGSTEFIIDADEQLETENKASTPESDIVSEYPKTDDNIYPIYPSPQETDSAASYNIEVTGFEKVMKVQSILLGDPKTAVEKILGVGQPGLEDNSYVYANDSICVLYDAADAVESVWISEFTYKIGEWCEDDYVSLEQAQAFEKRGNAREEVLYSELTDAFGTEGFAYKKTDTYTDYIWADVAGNYVIAEIKGDIAKNIRAYWK